MENKELLGEESAGYRVEHRVAQPEAEIVPQHRTDRRKYLLPDNAIATIIDACRSGVPETKIARALGINYRTWMRVRDEDERVSEVLLESRKIEEEELVSILLDKARAGDLPATIFALKSRHGYRDIGTAGGGVEQKVNVTILLPAPAATEEEFSRTINARVDA